MTISEINEEVNATLGCGYSVHDQKYVTTSGFVSGIKNNGFFMQETTTGGPYTGIWVYLTGSEFVSSDYSVGDEVQIVGQIYEFYDFTSLTPSSITIVSAGHTMVPVSATTGDLGSGCTDSGEELEGVLITLSGVTILGPADNHGQIAIDDGSGVTQLEDGMLNTDRYLEDLLGTENLTGIVIANLTGVVRYDFGDFEIHPRDEADIVLGIPPSPPPPLSATCACQDPHLQLAHGGRTDFRGKNATIYNFLSSKNVSVSMRTLVATFRLGKNIIHGSFLTEAHVVLRTNMGRFFNVSLLTNVLNANGWSWRFARGSCAKPGNHVAFVLGPHSKKQCDNLWVEVIMSSMIVHTQEWKIIVKALPVYNRIDGPRHRLDIQISQRVSDDRFEVFPHGLIGQSFDRDSKPRRGKVDHYPPRSAGVEFTTSAMGEGAIDGLADQYEMSSPYDIEFAYSRFNALATLKPSNASRLALTNAGATEYDEDDESATIGRRLSECECPG